MANGQSPTPAEILGFGQPLWVAFGVGLGSGTYTIEPDCYTWAEVKFPPYISKNWALYPTTASGKKTPDQVSLGCAQQAGKKAAELADAQGVTVITATIFEAACEHVQTVAQRAARLSQSGGGPGPTPPPGWVCA